MLGARTRGRQTTGQLYRMDPIADGNPIGWTVRTLETKLPKMLERAGYPQIAAATDMAEVTRVLPEVEACARDVYARKRNTVKHNRGGTFSNRVSTRSKRQPVQSTCWSLQAIRSSLFRQYV